MLDFKLVPLGIGGGIILGISSRLKECASLFHVCCWSGQAREARGTSEDRNMCDKKTQLEHKNMIKTANSK